MNTHVAPGYNGTGVRMYVVKVNGQEAAQVARSLYGSCSFFMERKRARAAAVSEVMAEKQRRAIAREQAVIRRYVDGDSVDEICKQVEVSGTYLYSTLRKNNVTLRGRSRGKKNRA